MNYTVVAYKRETTDHYFNLEDSSELEIFEYDDDIKAAAKQVATCEYYGDWETTILFNGNEYTTDKRHNEFAKLVEEETAIIKEERRQAEAKQRMKEALLKRQERERKRIQQEEQERAEYERLKEKFGKESSQIFS